MPERDREGWALLQPHVVTATLPPQQGDVKQPQGASSPEGGG